MTEGTDWVERDQKATRLVTIGISVWTLFVAGVVYTVLLINMFQDSAAWMPFLKEHFAACFGLRAAATGAFILVTFLRQIEGPIEFEAFGFKFKGASGQIVLWVFCFLAISAVFKWLW